MIFSYKNSFFSFFFSTICHTRNDPKGSHWQLLLISHVLPSSCNLCTYLSWLSATGNHRWTMPVRCKCQTPQLHHPTFSTRTTQLYQINLNLRRTSIFTLTIRVTWGAWTSAKLCAISRKIWQTTFLPRSFWWWRSRFSWRHRTLNSTLLIATITWTHQLNRTCRRYIFIHRNTSRRIPYRLWT